MLDTPDLENNNYKPQRLYLRIIPHLLDHNNHSTDLKSKNKNFPFRKILKITELLSAVHGHIFCETFFVISLLVFMAKCCEISCDKIIGHETSAPAFFFCEKENVINM